MKIKMMILVVVSIALSVFAEKIRLDNPFEVGSMFGSVGKGDIVLRGRGQRVLPDYNDRIKGDFSIVYTSDTTAAREIGFMTAPSSDAWQVGLDWQLVINIKTNNPIVGKWETKIIDARGGQATYTIDAITGNQWKKLVLNASDFSPGYGRFDFSKIVAFQLQAAIGNGNQIRFDDVYFIRNDGKIVGVSDKTIEQFSLDEAKSRNARVRSAFSQAATSTSRNTLYPFIAKLYINENTPQVNARLLEIFKSQDPRIMQQYGTNQIWHLTLDSALLRLYHTFGTNSKIFPGRLNQDAEYALLSLLWERNKQRNDISLARQSSWWLVANETNDVISKAISLLSSQIFMNEKAFSELRLPNTGTGGGYGYWFHSSQSQWDGPQGEGDFKDDRTYRPLEHYYAYIEFFKRYFKDRANRGLFIEHGSSLYSQYSLMPIYDIYSMCEDRQLRQMAGKFLDLYWSLWAQEQLAGIRGGARIRDIASAAAEKDSDYLMGRFLLGGGGDANGPTLSQVLSGYNLPAVVWEIALDRKGLGEFQSISRLPGEEQRLIPRPAGTERTLLCDTESALVSYSHITPDYIMGCRMDSPIATHSYISNTGTKYGVTFPTIAEPAVFLWGVEVIDEINFVLSSDSGNFRSKQHKNVMLIQQARNTLTISPQWFPQKSQLAMEMGISLNPAIKNITEKEGWIFIEEGTAYLAIRVVRGEFSADYRGSTDWFDTRASDSIYAEINRDSYEWNRDKTLIRLKDIYSPVILKVASKKDFPDLDAFVTNIMTSRVALLKTVVPGWHILEFTTEIDGEQHVFKFNAANSQVPTVNDKPVNYTPAKLYDSPFITSDYGSGIIKISKGEYELTLDFN